jgi:RNA ligase (TIGR02306 family)
MSTHKVEVIRIATIEKHPNADALDLVRIDGFTCAVRRGDFVVGDLVVYVEPDYVVPPTGPFAFLATDGNPVRIKAKKLRGIYSMGLLVKAPEGAIVGDDVMEAMGIVRYEPPMPLSTGGDEERPHPSLASIPKYDLESWRRHRSVLELGERVILTEKIHGASARYAYRDGRIWCGSRTGWKREDENSVWWRALTQSRWIVDWCKEYDSTVLYGEVFGQVQDLKYGAGRNEVFFRAFDVLTSVRTWIDAHVLPLMLPESGPVPTVYDGHYDPVTVETLALADSKLASHPAEGVVIKPAAERTDPYLGRVALKLVSNRYLERA